MNLDTSNSVSIDNLLSVLGAFTVSGTGYKSGKTTIAENAETIAIQTTESYPYASLGDFFFRTGCLGGSDYNASIASGHVFQLWSFCPK